MNDEIIKKLEGLLSELPSSLIEATFYARGFVEGKYPDLKFDDETRRQEVIEELSLEYYKWALAKRGEISSRIDNVARLRDNYNSLVT